MTQASQLHQALCLRWDVWYGDQVLELPFSFNWDVITFRPDTPPKMTSTAIAAALQNPVGQPPLRVMCRGSRRPLIIIDDVNRPTPVDCVLPLVLRDFHEAGIPASGITILLATGTHFAPRMESVLSKVGPEAASKCKIFVHDGDQPVVHLGKTRFGTPVYVNKHVITSDFVMGIGGIYPNQSAGYGGGSKLALGVLGFRSILCLHYSHGTVGRAVSAGRNSFREDLDDIAQMLRIRTMISVHINGDREPVRICSGNYLKYYEGEAAFARRTFTVPPPGDADVVISNAYPMDLSLTFAFMKGAAPLHCCEASSSRILLARCSEGVGGHGLFPNINAPRFFQYKNYARFTASRPIACGRRVTAGLARRIFCVQKKSSNKNPTWGNRIWLHTYAESTRALPTEISNARITSSWKEILSAVNQEQHGKEHLKVAVYPCAPLVGLATT